MSIQGIPAATVRTSEARAPRRSDDTGTSEAARAGDDSHAAGTGEPRGISRTTATIAAVAGAAAIGIGALALYRHRTRPEHLIVVGGGPSGLDAAIRGAEAGFKVTVLEKHGQTASRKTIFNLAPAVVDSMTQLDNGGDELTKVLSPIVSRSRDAARGTVGQATRLEPGPAASEGAEQLIKGMTGEDARPWARVSIERLENHMRGYAGKRFADRISFRYDTALEGVTQNGRSVTAHVVDGKTGTKDTVQGAYMVMATGGRGGSLVGAERAMWPEQAHFVGGLIDGASDASEVIWPRAALDGAELAASTRHANPAGRTWASTGLPWDGGHGLVWAQVNKDAKALTDSQAAEIVLDRARALGLDDAKLLPGDRSIMRANVQLGLMRDQPAVRGRVILAGDELLVPYFPTSTGAGHALSVNGPELGTLFQRLRSGGSRDASAALSAYDGAARQGAEEVARAGRELLLRHLGMPAREWADDLKALDAAQAARVAAQGG